MMKTYVTKQGDLWDSIAHDQLGSTKHTDLLINANIEKIDYFVFPAGVKLNIPDVSDSFVFTPPWRKAVG